jgi:broad specificity phosphatase PhoE
MAGTPVRILLARHGETEFNVQGRWQGQADSPLTTRGQAQARELGRALAIDPIGAVYSSDLGRAAQTAAVVAAPHGLTVITDPRLREIAVGAWTGLNRAEIEALTPGLVQRWSTEPSTMQLPGGETLTVAQARVLAFFAARMPAHADETIVVITHGAIGQTILAAALGRPLSDLWLKERMDNCQISRLAWTPADGLELIELCDVRHLESVGSLNGWRVTDQA